MSRPPMVTAPTPVRALLCCLAALAACTELPQGSGDRPEPVVLLGPWLTEPGPGQMTVAWVTSGPQPGEVDYGEPGKEQHRAREGQATTDHRVVLTGLLPARRYAYRVVGSTEEGRFTSPPDPAADPLQSPFTVLVYGDNRSNGGDHALVVRAAAAEHAQLALHTGDMVLSAREPKLWERWFATEAELIANLPLFATVGNHEITDKGVSYTRYFQKRGLPTYRAVDYGNVHVQLVDSFEMSAGADAHTGAVSEAQRSWAEADAKAVPADHHLWILVHQGPVTHPLHMRPGHGGLPGVRDLIARVAKVHPVEVVLAGHEHFYERGEADGLRYLVVGGGGAPLEDPDPAAPGVHHAAKALGYVLLDVCGCHVTGTTKDIAGHVVDRFVLSDCPQACSAPAAKDTKERAP